MSRFPNERLERSLQRLRPHRTRARYQQGCHCFQCRLAATQYQKDLLARHRAGEPLNRIVSAEPARKHMRKLRKRGVGLGTITEITGIARSTLCAIRAGRKLHIRESNERLILSVTRDAKIEGSRVSSKKTRKMIVKLNREGFTHKEIAKRTGVGRSAFVPSRASVYARTEMRVERFFNKIMAAA